MVEWTEKYRPKRLEDVVGNPAAKESLKKWADMWAMGIPKKRAVVLMGEPGVGKTTAALALASDMGWQVVEMNASDTRNADAIREVATHGALGETFMDSGEFVSSREGKRKLILLDEADNIFGKEDFGGVKAIAQTIVDTQQPIILIVNDWYSLKRRSSVIQANVATIGFMKPREGTIASLLRSIARAEGVEAEDEVIARLAKGCGGDVRAAIKDLQSVSEGRARVAVKDLASVGNRDHTISMMKAVDEILRTGNCKRAKEIASFMDEDPETLILWMDQNVPTVYRDAADLHAAYEALSRADIFLGRVRRRSNYALWAYASDMMTCGVALAKSRDYRGYTKLSFPLWLMKMSRSRSVRETRKALAGKIGRLAHAHERRVIRDILPYFKAMYAGDREFRLQMTRRLNLTEEEVGFLLDTKSDTHPVRHVFDALRKVDAVSKAAPKEEESGGAEADGEAAQEDGQDTGDSEPRKDGQKPQKSLFEFG